MTWVCLRLTLASVTLNSLRMYWGMLYSAIGSTTKYWYLAERSAGQYWWHFSCQTERDEVKSNLILHIGSCKCSRDSLCPSLWVWSASLLSWSCVPITSARNLPWFQLKDPVWRCKPSVVWNTHTHPHYKHLHGTDGQIRQAVLLTCIHRWSCRWCSLIPPLLWLAADRLAWTRTAWCSPDGFWICYRAGWHWWSGTCGLLCLLTAGGEQHNQHLYM